MTKFEFGSYKAFPFALQIYMLPLISETVQQMVLYMYNSFNHQSLNYVAVLGVHEAKTSVLKRALVSSKSCMES